MPFIQCITFVSPVLGSPKRVDAIMNLSLFEIGIATALSSDFPEVVLTVAGNTVTGGSLEVATTVAGCSGVDSCRRGRVPSIYKRVRIDAITTLRTTKGGSDRTISLSSKSASISSYNPAFASKLVYPSPVISSE